ncbi:hypothetical protein [Micromonospora aurantiaca (nom. illeg.)]|uniref:hypothetical protein n=1 Tax=Micromonospora aurantiaca (nom. illeg.) TaxID=47850 RepID=UPI003F4A14D1
MRRSGLSSAPAGRWDGLVVHAERPSRPALRVEVAGGRRLLIRQAGRVVLLSRQRARARGVFYARTGLYRSPIPPIGAAHARRIRETSADDDAWAARWAHQFTDWLQAAEDGPLHGGCWALARGMPSWSVPGHWQRFQDVDPDRGHITWFGYGDPDEDQRDVLPLRRLSAAGAGRVRSYRRQLREGVLPPALLWWVSGLNTLLVLDGHDRLTAALAEQAVPEVLVLAPAVDPEFASAWQRRLVREYVGRMTSPHPARGDSVSRRLATALGDIARTEGRTRAWPLPGGSAVWDRYATELAPGWATNGQSQKLNSSSPTVAGVQ